MQNPVDIRIFESIREFEQKSAEEIVHLMQGAIRDRGVCRVVLSGGETPKGIYRLLGADPLRHLLDWSRVSVFFSDERCVSPDDSQSNFGMAERALTSHVGIAPHNIHRICAEISPPKAAIEYEKVLRTIFSPGPPRFDVMLLGIGSDGHTASLFPSTDAVREENRWVCEVYVPHLNAWRVTLTFPVINCGRTVFILATGESKAPMIERALRAHAPTRDLPITLVRPVEGALCWRLDKQAASRLSASDG